MSGGPRAGALRVGDLVVCASRAFREQARLAPEVGMYLVDRSRDGLVFFAGSDRRAWIPKPALLAVAPDDPRVVPPPAWLARLHAALRLLGATEVELERREEGGFEARLGCAGLTGALLLDLARLLGLPVEGLAVRPGSMSRVVVVFPAGGGGEG